MFKKSGSEVLAGAIGYTLAIGLLGATVILVVAGLRFLGGLVL